MLREKYGVGTIHKNNKDEEFEIVEKINLNKRKIKFLKSKIEVEVYVSSIKNKSVYKQQSKSIYSIGDIFVTKEGYEIEIIEVLKGNSRIIEFKDDYRAIKRVTIQNIYSRNIRNPNHPTVYGIGYIGSGDYKTSIGGIHTKEYSCWKNMMTRVNYDKYKISFPTYINVTICDEWLNFQNFAKWYNDNYPKHIKGIKFELDKDLLQDGVKNKIYSPMTCIFLPQIINSFLSNIKSNNTSGKIGVCWDKRDKRWITMINDFSKAVSINLGSYINLNEASVAYEEAREFQSERAKDYLRELNYLSENIIQLIK